MEIPLQFTSIVCLLNVFLFGKTVCHPQCLDFKPPFDQHNTLQFCTEYSTGATCCSAKQDQAIRERYEGIKLRIPSSILTGCEGYIKDFLCQECSPYAAHVFDAEGKGVPRKVPGLCSGYCDTFYDKCNAIVPYMYNINEVIGGQTLENALRSKETFCPAVRLGDTDYCYPELLTNSVLNGDISRETRNQPGCLCVEEFASGLANPLIFRMVPDDSGRIFIGQQRGIVEIFFKNKTKLNEPFMNIVDDVLLGSRAGDERGFLNLIFHPNFKENRKFYIFFSMQKQEDNRHYTRISEFQESTTLPNRVDKNSERIILDVYQPYSNHNGGEMLFDEAGYLYVFLGDGGAGGDPQGFAQNKNSLLGKVLRIDVNTGDDNIMYKIPSDNPFVNEEGTKDEIWAYGIRNIWRCDVDEGDPVDGYGKGRILCGDVGQNAYEEIDIIKKGGNYGWNSREGFTCYQQSSCGRIGSEELPIHAYPHSQGKSVTGGHVYRGCMNPNLQGQYIYGDFVSGRIWALTEDKATNEWNNKELVMCGKDVCFNGLDYDLQTNIMSFGEDDDGEIYIMTTRYGAPSSSNIGKVVKLIDPKRRGDPTTCRTYVPEPTRTTTTTPTTPQTAETSTASHNYTGISFFQMILILANVWR